MKVLTSGIWEISTNGIALATDRISWDGLKHVNSMCISNVASKLISICGNLCQSHQADLLVDIEEILRKLNTNIVEAPEEVFNMESDFVYPLGIRNCGVDSRSFIEGRIADMRTSEEIRAAYNKFLAVEVWYEAESNDTIVRLVKCDFYFHEDKAEILNSLAETLRKTRAGSDIKGIEYTVDEATCEEFAVIHWENGATKRVLVTGDSGISLIRDVTKAIN